MKKLYFYLIVISILFSYIPAIAEDTQAISKIDNSANLQENESEDETVVNDDTDEPDKILKAQKSKNKRKKNKKEQDIILTLD